MSRADELARQGALLALLAEDDPPSGTQLGHVAAPLDSGDHGVHGNTSQRLPARLRPDISADISGMPGLRAYQRNAQATAQRVLLAHFPTIAAMLGEDTLAALALILWRISPPASGDLGEWGAALPDLLAAHPDLQDWPWLPDSARLDWARHQCERAGDATLDAASLQRLGDTAPDQLRLVLMPCVALLSSPWPMRALWAAHQLPPQARAHAAQEALRQAISSTPAAGAPPGSMHHVLIWRDAAWQVQMADLSGAQLAWMQMLLEGDAAQAGTPPSLSSLLDHSPPGLDFEGWLGAAITSGWLWRVEA